MITELLTRWKAGDATAEEQLIALAYPTLLELARGQVRSNFGALTLQKTELAHEAFERLREQQSVDWQNREHFFAIAATVIRRVVVDHLRAKGAKKRGDGLPFIALSEICEDDHPSIEESVDWLSVDDALTELAELYSECARVVELKFFSGLSSAEIATVMNTSVATVGRQWRFAKAWLGQRLGAQN
jgi:RNA polymerase sigma factor (TIGR02999 family)